VSFGIGIMLCNTTFTECKVTRSRAVCYTHDVAVAKYCRHRFSCDFIDALNALNASLSNQVS